MDSIRELGGFAEYEEDIDGTEEEFNAFNYCMAQSYANAMYREDFEELGEFSPDLLENICRWLNYTEEMNNLDIVQEIKNGKLMTIKERTFIDAIYENKSSSLAETYLLNGVYSPKLVLTIILSDEEDYEAYIIGNSQEDFDNKIKELYDFIEEEFNKCSDKKMFLNKIKENYNRIKVSNKYKSKPVSTNTYNWAKKLKKINKEKSN
jgi:hypothetical protein